ncbi:hypothetical protein llap_8522 [Limosa lapponica baueri]|uniref:Uncharacterized protein n=1 Tax=Limosa lapponica baueri TaxID=1758121 RepID=A0A2I0U515_LIMLA|nr:hypothetical protein llap_8522 [Limosa lapponica baueri]
MIQGQEGLSYEDRLRVGVVQPGEEKALGRPYTGLSVHKGGYRRDGEGFLIREWSARTRGNDFELKELAFGSWIYQQSKHEIGKPLSCGYLYMHRNGYSPFRYQKATTRSYQSLLFSRLSNPNSLSLSSQQRGSSSLSIFMTLLKPLLQVHVLIMLEAPELYAALKTFTTKLHNYYYLEHQIKVAKIHAILQRFTGAITDHQTRYVIRLFRGINNVKSDLAIVM